jgi:hypothetical protein
MCLRFTFCIHQRVCVLNFLLKSQILCTLVYTLQEVLANTEDIILHSSAPVPALCFRRFSLSLFDVPGWRYVTIRSSTVRTHRVRCLSNTAWPQSSPTRIQYWVPWSSGIQVDEVKSCNKEEITAIRIFTVSQKGSHSVQKLKLVFLST